MINKLPKGDIMLVKFILGIAVGFAIGMIIKKFVAKK